MNAASFTEHPLYASLAQHGRRWATRVRQVPVHLWRFLVIAVVLLWAVHNMANIFWLLFPSPELEQPPLVAPPTITDAGSQTADVDLAAMQQLALFGKGGEVSASVPVPQETMLPGIETDAVDTSLNLRLQGVIASSDPDNAWAIIADGNRQALYKVGDKLPQGTSVNLVKVLEQRVILDNNGRYESLWLYSEEDAQRRATASRDYRPPMDDNEYQYEEPYDYTAEGGADGGTPPPVEGEPDGGQPAVEPEVYTLPQSAEEITSISEVVRFTAARGDGGLVGYQVQPGRNRELFDQAGLRPGDIVTAVNGINLDDPRQIRSVYQDLQTATQAELDILRDGESVSINISLDSAR